MDLRATKGVASRFAEYVEHLCEVIGHVDRHGPLASYCTGLLLPGERKSVEPMAARLAPGEVSAKHQSLHHFVAKAPWGEAALLGAVRAFVLPKMEDAAPFRAWITGDFNQLAIELNPFGTAARKLDGAGPFLRCAAVIAPSEADAKQGISLSQQTDHDPHSEPEHRVEPQLLAPRTSLQHDRPRWSRDVLASWPQRLECCHFGCGFVLAFRNKTALGSRSSLGAHGIATKPARRLTTPKRNHLQPRAESGLKIPAVCWRSEAANRCAPGANHLPFVPARDRCGPGCGP